MEEVFGYFENIFEKAREEGIIKEKIATAKRMAKKHMPLSDIAECTDLSVEEVQKIIKR